MVRKTLLFVLVLAAACASVAYAGSNLGSTAAPVFAGHRLSPDAGGIRILYAPSENDDPAYRATMAAHLGGTCDYFDTRFDTPSLSVLLDYDGVMTWANYAYFDNVAFGNNLADFVDAGGRVVLGAFCAYTAGNYLSGRIMTDTDRYCPVTGGFNHFSLSFWDGSDPYSCSHWGITSYGATYRDYLTVVGPWAEILGHFQDGEIANALNRGQTSSDVTYANGAGGYPLFPSGQDAQRAANSFLCCMICGEGTPTEPATWSAVKALFQ